MDSAPAIRRSIARVKAGEPALIDVATQPRQAMKVKVMKAFWILIPLLSTAVPAQTKAGDVESGFDAVGNEDVSVADEATDDFRGRENQVYDHAEECDTRPSLQIARGDITSRMIVHAEGND